MLVVVLAVLVAAGALLVAALATGASVWGWGSAGLSAVAGGLLVYRSAKLRRARRAARGRHRSGTAVPAAALIAAAARPAAVGEEPHDFDEYDDEDLDGGGVGDEEFGDREPAVIDPDSPLPAPAATQRPVIEPAPVPAAVDPVLIDRVLIDEGPTEAIVAPPVVPRPEPEPEPAPQGRNRRLLRRRFAPLPPIAPDPAAAAKTEPVAAAPGPVGPDPADPTRPVASAEPAEPADSAEPAEPVMTAPEPEPEPEPVPLDLPDPEEEDTDAADVLIVSERSDPVQVVDEYPRYHLAECQWLIHREFEPLPVSEARELGFTPCTYCTPDAVIVERHRAISRS